MKLYLVERNGVYPQGIVGIYSTLEKAQEGKKYAKSFEKDDYHNFSIEEFELDCTAVILSEEQGCSYSPDYASRKLLES